MSSSLELINSLIPKKRSSFFDKISSGFIVPVSTFFSRVTFSLIFCPSCSCVIPFLFLASLMTLGNSGFKIISSVKFILFWGGGLFLGIGLGLEAYEPGFVVDIFGEYCNAELPVVFAPFP